MDSPFRAQRHEQRLLLRRCLDQSGLFGHPRWYQILNNIIQNNISGIELDNDGTYQTKVQYNLIQNNNNSGPGRGNGIETNFGLATR